MTQYAIIKTGGKQYRVQQGDVIDVELLDVKEDGTIDFDQVLLMFDGKNTSIGSPTLANSIVRGTLVNQVRGPKVFAYKYKRRKNYSRKVGHRQDYLRVRITELSI
jgi:large subunit ribosomal protein L21